MKLFAFYIFLINMIIISGCNKESEHEEPQENQVVVNTEPLKFESTSITFKDKKIVLNWKINHPDSVEYLEIYRSIQPSDSVVKYFGSVIKTIKDTGVITFIDSTYPLIPEVGYTIHIKKKNYYTNIPNRSRMLVYKSDKAYLKMEPSNILLHKNSNTIILITPQGVITTLNYLTKEIKSITTDKYVGYASIKDDKLYVPNIEGGIYIIDIATLKQESIIQDMRTIDFQSVAINNNYIFTCTSNSHGSISAFKLSTKEKVYVVYKNNVASPNEAYLRYYIHPDNLNEICGINSQYLFKYSVDNEANVIAIESNIDYNESLNSLLAYVPNTSKIITGTNGYIYDRNQHLAFVNSLPKGNDLYSDYLFNNSGSKLYASCSNSRSITIYRMSDLMRIGSIKTEGIPIKLFYHDGQIIAISKSSDTNTYLFVERIDLNLMD